MNKTMNKEQKNYLFAKAYEKTTESILDEMEVEYIKAKNIRNPDGTIPKALYAWNVDDETAYAAIDDLFAIPEVAKAAKDHTEAKHLLRAAEDALIAFGISIVPVGIRPALQKAAKHWKYRDELIEITLSVNAKTIPKDILKAVRG